VRSRFEVLPTITNILNETVRAVCRTTLDGMLKTKSTDTCSPFLFFWLSVVWMETCDIRCTFVVVEPVGKSALYETNADRFRYIIHRVGIARPC